MRTLRWRTVAKTLSTGLDVRRWSQCSAGKSKNVSRASVSLVRQAAAGAYLIPYFPAKTSIQIPSPRFMHSSFRPEAGRTLPGENLRILRALTTRRAQIVAIRKRLAAQIGARKTQNIPADVEGMDDALKTMLDAQVGDLERRIERAIAQEDSSAAKARLPRSIPGIGPASRGHADRGTAGTRPDDRRRGRSHDRPRSGAARQGKDAGQAGNR